MGAACSLGDEHPSHDVKRVHTTALHSSYPSASPAPPDDHPSPHHTSLPHHLWTSIVVGESIKPPPSAPPPPLPIYDDTSPTLYVVQSMIKSGASYALIRKTSPADAAAAALPSSALKRRAQADVYVGMVDWRDLNALLVAVCKTNRLHGAPQVAQGVDRPTPSAATAAAQNALRLQQEAGEVGAEKRTSQAEVASVGSAETAAVLLPSSPMSSSAPSPQPWTPAGGASTPGRAVGRPLIPTTVPATGSPSSAVRSAKGGVSPIQLTKTVALAAAALSMHAQAAKRASLMSAAAPSPADSAVAPLLSPSASSASSSSLSSFGSAASPSPSTFTPLTPYLHFLDMKRTPIGLISNLSQRNPLTVVNTACPLLGAAQLLTGVIGHTPAPEKGGKASIQRLWAGAKGGKGGEVGGRVPPPTRPELYRLAVLDKDGRFMGCLTQLRLAAWVRERMDRMGDTADQSLHALGLGRSRRVMSIGWRSPVLTALLLMHDRRLSALAIVNDSNGALVGTISCSDIKHLFLAPDLMLTLSKPVSAFVSMLRQSTSYWHVNIAGEKGGEVSASASVVVRPTTGLREAVDVLLKAKVRRAWVVNDAEQPIGMLSIADIVKLALPQPALHASPAPHHSTAGATRGATSANN